MCGAAVLVWSECGVADVCGVAVVLQCVLYWCVLQVQTTVADDFALNLSSVLLDLCKPFMDPTNPKAAAIELALCHRSDVLNLTKSVSTPSVCQ